MKKMLGFIVDQPLHKSIRQLRIPTLMMLFASVDIMYRLIAILEQGSTLSPNQTMGAVATLAAAVFASIWRGISNLSESQKNDD